MWPLIIAVIFIILKLTEIIAWSWWWVCSPLIIIAGYNFIMSAVFLANGLSSGKSIEEIRNDLKTLCRRK